MNISDHIIRQRITSRGGGIEINLTPYGFDGHRMAAYQNYLGGGLLGSIKVNDSIRSQVGNVRLQLQYSDQFDKLDSIGDELMRYFHELTNPSSEWESADFDQLQTRPSSAY